MFDPQNGLYNATISEDASIGLSVTMVTATDQDSGSQGDVSYSIVAGNTGNKFAIDTTLGNISTIGELDRETTAVFTLTVRASDGAVPEKVRYADGTVEVVISDVNDNAPSFNTSSIVTTAPENASIGDVIITLQAYDPDEGLNSEVRYSIKSGNDVGLFTLNSTTGELQVNASYDLDQEPRPNFNHYLVIFVEDLGTPERLNSSVQLNISITAVNEFTPQLLHASSFNFSFAENAAVGDGVTVVRVNATDQDYGDQGRVSYVIHSGTSQSLITARGGYPRYFRWGVYEPEVETLFLFLFCLPISDRVTLPWGIVQYPKLNIFTLTCTYLFEKDKETTLLRITRDLKWPISIGS